MTLAVLGLLCALPGPVLLARECVVLLHGLARTAGSMQTMADALTERGYLTANIGYPSRTAPIETLAPQAVAEGVAQCQAAESNVVHFVTHSLGGILVRYALRQPVALPVGHVVMLAPPNQGSEVVDRWRRVPGYRALNGPAGLQLGTDETSVPLALGPVEFSLGVIAGTRTMNPLLSLSLPNPDDGKVSVASTRVAGMTDHIQVARTHTFIMRAPEVIEQVAHFLRHGSFEHIPAAD